MSFVDEGNIDAPAVDKTEKKKKKRSLEVQAEGEDVTMDERESHNKCKIFTYNTVLFSQPKQNSQKRREKNGKGIPRRIRNNSPT
jgi:SHS2 domain-containing protein